MITTQDGGVAPLGWVPISALVEHFGGDYASTEQKIQNAVDNGNVDAIEIVGVGRQGQTRLCVNARQAADHWNSRKRAWQRAVDASDYFVGTHMDEEPVVYKNVPAPMASHPSWKNVGAFTSQEVRPLNAGEIRQLEAIAAGTGEMGTGIVRRAWRI